MDSRGIKIISIRQKSDMQFPKVQNLMIMCPSLGIIPSVPKIDPRYSQQVCMNLWFDHESFRGYENFRTRCFEQDLKFMVLYRCDYPG